MGIVNLAFDFGLKFKATVHIDASATFAITQRQGLGKLRHFDLHWFWIQEKVKHCKIAIHKVNGKEDPADLFTKHLPKEEVHKHIIEFNFKFEKGRAAKSLTIHGIVLQYVDHWINDKQCIVRIHAVSRRNLCDPYQCKGAPRLGTLTSTRVIHGTVDDGIPFIRQDNWTCINTRHLDLGRSWTGRIALSLKISSHPSSSDKSPLSSVSPVPSGLGERLDRAPVRPLKGDFKRNRIQLPTRRQQELFRDHPDGGNYGSETRARVLTRKWREVLSQHPPPA